jgi:hypothetical protein
MELDNIPINFRRGRTFLGCISHQQTLHNNMLEADQKATAATALEAMGRANRQEARIQAEKATSDYNKARAASRTAAKAEALQCWGDRWDDIHAAAAKQDEKARNYSKSTSIKDFYVGLDHHGLAVHHRGPLEMSSDTHSYSSQTMEAFNRTKMFLMDLRDSPNGTNVKEVLVPILKWIKYVLSLTTPTTHLSCPHPSYTP